METVTNAEAVAQRPQRSSLNIIIRNTLFGVGAQLALRGFGFLFSVLVIRRLGDTQYGQYSVVLAWAGIFSFLGDMGIAQYMTREIARNKDRLMELFWDVTVIRFILAVFVSILTTVGAQLAGYDPRMVLAIGLYTSTYFLQAVLAPLAGVLAGYERLDAVSVYLVVGQVIFMVFGALFLFAGFDFVWLVIASIINLPVLIVLCAWTIRRNHFAWPKFAIHAGTWMRLIIAGLPFAFIQISLTTAYQFDRLILEPLVAKEFIGWYSAAYTLTRSLLIITAAFSSSLVLTLAREHAQNPDVVRPWYYRSVKFVLFIGLPMPIACMILSEKIIRLFYGVQYAPAAIAFAILIWDTPLLMYTSLGGNMTTSIQKERVAMWIYVCEAILNIVTNIILIPQYGIIAACFTTVATELVGVILFYLFFRREFGAGVGLTHILRLCLAALVMGVVVFLLRNFNLVISISAGLVVYVAMVWVLKALTPEERDLLVGFARRIFGKVLARVRR